MESGWGWGKEVEEEDVEDVSDGIQTAVSLPSAAVELLPFCCCASLTGEVDSWLPLVLPFSVLFAWVASVRFKFSALPSFRGPSLPSLSLIISPGFSSSMRACDSPSPTVRRRPKRYGMCAKSGFGKGQPEMGLVESNRIEQEDRQKKNTRI